MKIGVCQKDLRGDLQENLKWLSKNGFDGYQIWKGQMDAASMSAKELVVFSQNLGLEVSAVGGGPNLVNPKVAAKSIESFKTFLDLSVELGPCIVTAETKAKPADLNDSDAWKATIETVGEICRYAEEVGAFLAIECAGPCFVRDHNMWLVLSEKVGSKSLKVNYDPANIVWAKQDEVEAARVLGKHIVHTHAKDIAFFKDGVDEKEERHQDVPAGEGLVHYPEYLNALHEAGYEGFLTIEMHAGDKDRRDDILKSADRLREYAGERVNG